MLLVVRPSSLAGAVTIPPSKSHTIRAVLIAALAEGTSTIINPLDSADGRSAVTVARAFGASVDLSDPGRWIVDGTGGDLRVPDDVVDVGNSGTSCRIGLGVASLCRGTSVFTGDDQARRRPMGPLLEALNTLGAKAFSTKGDGTLPVEITGPIRGGAVTVSGITSQYVTSLLIATPLAPEATEITVHDLHEKPYVGMTLWWLDRQGIVCEREGLERFTVKGAQRYRADTVSIPGDFSSATFFLAAGAIGAGTFTLRGLDMADTQGDKAVVEMLQAMGARIDVDEEGLTVGPGELVGQELDLNDTPDALPALAVVGCFARGRTVLRNVPQARIKETDRISTMAKELTKLGARVEELPDGLIVHESALKGTAVEGWADHRIVMALAVAGLRADGSTTITSPEAIEVTFPTFIELMASLGADMRLHGP
ncbi:MAG: 3-phosphoshikimate 1-carboxyvinyltransferase [bacterium]|nr:3-phosphoshikimate 1-carboxyvinyltransferase [bacterium]